MMPICCSIKDAVRASGISRTKLYELMDAGNLAYAKVGTRRLVRCDSLEKLLTAAQPEPIVYEKKPSLIYFIRDGELVKIGLSNEPSARLRELNTGNGRQLEMLATMPGDREKEKSIHRKFEKHNVKGEWFHLCAPILKYIAAYRR